MLYIYIIGYKDNDFSAEIIMSCQKYEQTGKNIGLLTNSEIESSKNPLFMFRFSTQKTYTENVILE